MHEDPLYKLPDSDTLQEASCPSDKPGTLLKVEENVNTSSFTLPPELALSRVLYNTEQLNRTVVPISAYILWPWSPRTFKNVTGYPVVAWGRGTSGITGECAPSHLRNLSYQYHAPFPLALAGYIVVALDYAGLGVDHDYNGTFIPH